MSLTNKALKEILSRAGVPTENISGCVDEIMVGHNASVDALTEARDKYKAEAEKVPKLQKELDEANQTLAKGEKSPYKVKYEAKVEELATLQQEFDDYKAEETKKQTKMNKESAYRQLLKNAGVAEKRIDAILKVTSLDEMELDKEGKLTDAEKLTEDIKSEWADFIVTTTEKGASVSKPPQNSGGKKVWTKDEIMKIKDTAERQKAWAEMIEQERNK